jgi:hypothetical protein
MKRLMLCSFIVALLLTTTFVVTAQAGLTIGSSGGLIIAVEDDPNMPVLPESTLSSQRLIAVEADPNNLME